MNILIDTIRVAGFRGIKNLEVSLPRIAVLIGTNNSGKTSLIKAFQLAIGDYSRYLSEEDFYIGDDDEHRAEEILIDVRVTPMDKNGKRTELFNEIWVSEFGDSIKSEASGFQYLAIRTLSKPDIFKGGFETTRVTLEKWPEYDTWQTETIKKTKILSRFPSMQFISIEAQRDIHQELKEKTSFVGKVLSSISYDKADVVELEALIKGVNEKAVDKSEELVALKSSLENLNQSLQGSANAEITPFPKKIRDLSKHFSVHVGEQNTSNTFSMEYHGMGTRSWASMLTVKAFVDLATGKHLKEEKPFFPILALEEPEAHLHPNAQKMLYSDLVQSKGQVIISTHSPYLVAMADVAHLRSLKRVTATGSVSFKVLYQMTDEERKILAREIMNKRGEILFSRALILCEGITEEQIIPAMFDIYFNKSLYTLGISCISVGGKNYAPFVKLACSLGIPVYILSDNDGTTKKEIEAQLRRLKQATKLGLEKEIFGISYLTDGNDFEAELLQLNLRDELILAIALSEMKGSDNIRYKDAKLKEINGLPDSEILIKIRDAKSSYSGYLGAVLLDNARQKKIEERIPLAITTMFESLKVWISL